MPHYTAEELMACLMARAIGDGERVGVGVNSPLPAAAVVLAARTHAPGLRYWLRGVDGSAPFIGSKEFFDFAQSGKLDVFFLSGVQIDESANLNLHLLGDDPDHPRRRFPGAFGSAVLYYVVPRVIVFRTEHSPRVFVPHVDFVTAGGETEPGVPRSGGPALVVTPRAVLSYERQAGRLELASFHPGESVKSVRAQTGFPLAVREDVHETPPPSAEELSVLREEVYPRLAARYPVFTARQAATERPA
jgi:glutaconate CoA-transferase, subunit B